MSYTLRQRKAYRTRIQFESLLGKPSRCQILQQELGEITGIKVEVRIKTGSVIIEHPKSKISLGRVVSAVETVCVADKAGTGLTKNSSRSLPKSTLCSSKEEKKYHLSGTGLLLSGVYLVYLSLKRVVFGVGAVLGTTTGLSALSSVPALAAMAISLPVQRQALDNLKATGKPDMGLISTGILYFSLFTGNILASYTVFWLFNLSGWLESRIKAQTRQSIRNLLSAEESKVWLLLNGEEVEVDVKDIAAGDTLIFRYGEKIPIDGLIVHGEGLTDEAMMTGESSLVYKRVSDCVLAGTMVAEGEIHVLVEKTGEDTRLAAIIRLIENAENEQGELQITSQQFSQRMVPFSLSVAAFTFMFTGNLLQAMAVLIITCPCAIRLSTSVAISSAMTVASSEGILVKGGKYIELAGRVNALAVDKTGTLAIPSPSQVALQILDKRFAEDTIVCLAAAMQRNWPHPVGRSIVAMAIEKRLSIPKVESAELFSGKGVCGFVNGKRVIVGSILFLRQSGIELSLGQKNELESSYSGGSQIFVASEKRILGVFSATQEIRERSKQVISRLKSIGVDPVVLLSGDRKENTLGTGQSLGFDKTCAEMSPEDKADWISEYRKEHSQAVIGMIGDGINDTPAFAASDLSMSVAEGKNQVAVEYSDVVLQNGGLEKSLALIELGQTTDKTIKRS